MDLKGRKSINKAVLMWAVVALLLLIMATPALSTLFAAPGSVNTRAIVNGAVKTKKIANGVVNSAKIKDGSITNVDVAGGAAIAASKINRTGLNADLLDGLDSGSLVRKSGDTMTGNLTAGNLTYGSPRTGYLSIPASAFVPAWHEYGFGVSSGYLYAYPSGAPFTSGPISFLAPVNLPHGARVIDYTYQYYDNHASAYTYLYLYRWNGVSGSVDNDNRQSMGMVNSGTTFASTSWQTITAGSITNPVIDNQNYSYYLDVGLNTDATTNLRAGKIIIRYTYTSAGD